MGVNVNLWKTSEVS